MRSTAINWFLAPEVRPHMLRTLSMRRRSSRRPDPPTRRCRAPRPVEPFRTPQKYQYQWDPDPLRAGPWRRAPVSALVAAADQHHQHSETRGPATAHLSSLRAARDPESSANKRTGPTRAFWSFSLRIVAFPVHSLHPFSVSSLVQRLASCILRWWPSFPSLPSRPARRRQAFDRASSPGAFDPDGDPPCDPA